MLGWVLPPRGSAVARTNRTLSGMGFRSKGNGVLLPEQRPRWMVHGVMI